MIYFVTVLVSTTNIPSLSWIQANKSYSLLKVCNEHIEKKRDSIMLGLYRHFGNKLISIHNIKCMTYDQAIIGNTKLGH